MTQARLSSASGAFLLLLPLLFIGCRQPERTLVINSEPAGALMYLNGEEVGRTPLTYDFTWYSDYDVTLRKEGYETLKTHRALKAPMYMWIPFDLFSEMAGARDRQEWHFTMTPSVPTAADPQALFSRAEELKGELRSSRNTRPPTTYPTTLPASTQPVLLP